MSDFVLNNDYVQVDSPVGPRGAYLYVKTFDGTDPVGTYLPGARLRELAEVLTDLADSQEETQRVADLAALDREALDYSWASEADRQYIRPVR